MPDGTRPVRELRQLAAEHAQAGHDRPHGPLTDPRPSSDLEPVPTAQRGTQPAEVGK